jgi:hypothetical protein
MWYRRVEGQTDDDRRELARRIADLLIGGLT